MVSFDLSFILMLMKDIFEDEGALWTEGRISWISINRDSYQINKVQVINGFVVLTLMYCWGRIFERPVTFLSF